MSKYSRKLKKKVGSPPGSLIYTGDSDKKLNISIFDFNTHHLVQKNTSEFSDCLPYLRSKEKTWIHVSGINDAAKIAEIGSSFNLHPLLLEDVMNPMQRAKVEDYKSYLFIVARLLNIKSDNVYTLEDEQFSIVLGPNYLISFVEKETPIFKPIFERLQVKDSRMRKSGVDYLAYSLLDCVVDNYFLILEGIDKRLDLLEEEVLNHPQKKSLAKIQYSKQEVALLRRSIWPMREVINQLRKTDSPIIADSTKLFFFDVYDHIVQAIETSEGFRDITSGMLDIYMSNINLRTNEIMKVLTIITTIFVPLTFIASIYGMNFTNIPGLHSDWGFQIIILVMFFCVFLMLNYFYQKKWI